MSSTSQCPICRKALPENAKTLPFCSERCRLIDLGNWLGGQYRIATDEPTDALPDEQETT
jgi:endogenous inhibitor of DNA gyrase (YacG/DUF329 family)